MGRCRRKSAVAFRAARLGRRSRGRERRGARRLAAELLDTVAARRRDDRGIPQQEILQNLLAPVLQGDTAFLDRLVDNQARQISRRFGLCLFVANPPDHGADLTRCSVDVANLGAGAARRSLARRDLADGRLLHRLAGHGLLRRNLLRRTLLGGGLARRRPVGGGLLGRGLLRGSPATRGLTRLRFGLCSRLKFNISLGRHVIAPSLF